ncbi:hypothetical protein JCM14635_11480 [Megalodesulfovibrio paquesii]
MIVWILTCFLFLAVPVMLWGLGRRVVLAGHPAAAVRHRPGWPMRRPPRAVLIIPMTGASATMDAALQTLVRQEYPGHEVILVTQQEADPATAVARQLAATHAHVRHVLAGDAVRCGQKTHNQLAALATVPDEVQLFAFCDASHLAQPNFLAALLEPLLCQKARVATGYHVVLPHDARPGTLGQALVVLALHALQAIPGVRQPWGGALAMTRAAFDDLQVAALWGTNVVDDVSLAGRLAARGEHPAFAPAACLVTPLAQSVSGWCAWLTRQLAYPRFIMFGTWLGIGVGLFALSGLFLAITAAAVGFPAGLVPVAWGLPATSAVVLLLLVLRQLATLLPERPALVPWLCAGAMTLPLASWCVVQSARSRVMRWRHRAYVVGPGGRVERILDA